MPPKTDADPNATGTDDNGGIAAPAKSPKDGDWIPKSQFLAALQSANDRYAALEAKVNTLAAPSPPEPKAPTRAELLVLVADGTITQAVADAEWERQIVAKVTKDVEKKVTTATAGMSAAGRIDAELAGFKELVSEAWVDGTQERAKVAAAFKRLIARGLPETVSTELTALENVFGDLDSLRESKKARTGPAEQHSETGGRGSQSGTTTPADDTVKGLTAREKSHYERLIRQGVYKNWTAVKAERDFAAKRKAG